ncbi:MAG: aminomethyl-transferring glycine dehydrogenase subunit GcvPA [Firmicutes bacterium]|nr:aminomethyl-transferring glycine dehydrogenase subunit GcvPA [Bacillota bacterium]
MRYIPHTDKDRQDMLAAIGARSTDELFSDISPAVRLNRPLNLPAALSEMELATHLQELSEKNADVLHNTCFLGGGAYDHYVPSVINHMLLRGEFYTAYTPYQPEISQGTLQAIYEYQSLICELTGMDMANASMYDGASATAEAAIMAASHTSRGQILISSTVHPDFRRVVRTYLAGQGVKVLDVPMKDGVTDVTALKGMVGAETAAVIIQHPNFFGNLEPVEQVGSVAHGAGGLYVVAADPISLGILKAPGSYGADIVCGEGQSLGNAMSFGGPWLGFLASREFLSRRIPGRISGATTDHEGRRGFVLTLQTREQHIRREKATSNICSNQALNALAATIYLTLLGKQGIRKVAELSLQKAHYAFDEITKLERFKPAFEQPFFKEFAVRTTLDPESVVESLLKHHLLAGYPMGKAYREFGDLLLIAVTERRTREEIDHFAARLEELV